MKIQEALKGVSLRLRKSQAVMAYVFNFSTLEAEVCRYL